MRVLIAFDKFKGAVSARTACAVAGRALTSVSADASVDLCPLTDGGEGFVEVLTLAAGGRTQSFAATGPRGEPATAAVGFVELAALSAATRDLLQLDPPSLGYTRATQIAIVEMASASGLAPLPTDLRDPWRTTSRGTGELLRAAATKNVAGILLGVGGSATNDLGTGALSALGLSFVDAQDAPISEPVPAVWPRVAAIRGQLCGLPPIRVACDVSNPLLGPLGATAVYGPQKGLFATDVPRLEAEAARMAGLLRTWRNAADTGTTIPRGREPPSSRGAADHTNTPGSGAAGGIAFGLLTCADAQLVSGSRLFSSWCRLDERIRAADVVVTGEGAYDSTSLQGKGPGAIAAAAAQLGKRVIVLAGRVDAAPEPGIEAHAITPASMPLAEALATTEHLLTAAVQKVFSEPPSRL